MSLKRSAGAFVARERELDVLLGALDDARVEDPRVVLVYGEAGVGKSALLREFGRRAAAHGANVLVGASPPMINGHLPYAAFIGALRELAPQSSPAVDGVGSPTRMLEAVLDAVAAACAEGVAVVVLEDLQWADASTLDLLTALVRMLRDQRVVLAGSVRTDSIGEAARRALTELARHHRVARIDLKHFTREELRELALSRAGEYPSETELDWLFAHSGGNAFFCEQLIAAGGAGSGVPAILRDIILTRLRPLSDAEQFVVRLAATAGVEVEHDVLSSACALPEAGLHLAVRVLRDAGLLAPEPASESYAFPHALVREIIVDDTLPGERRRMHVALAEALEHATDAGRLSRAASHWSAAGEAKRALAAAVIAGCAAEAIGAPAAASERFERALELWPAVADPAAVAGLPRSQLLAHAGEAAGLAGDFDRAMHRLDEAIEAAEDAVAAGVLHARRGYMLYQQGRQHDAVAAAALGAELIGDRRVPERVHVLAQLARLRFLAGQGDTAVSCADDAVELATALGSPLELGTALTVRGFVSVFDDPPAATDLIQRGLARLPAGPETGEWRWRAINTLCIAALFDARWDEAIDLGHQADRLSTELGLARSLGAGALGVAANAMFWSGRWDACEQLIDDAIGRGPLEKTESHLRMRRSSLLAAKGRFEEADDNALMLERVHQQDDLQHALWLAHTRAHLALSRGDAHGALELVIRALESRSADYVSEGMALLLWSGVTAAAELGDRRTAESLADSARAIGIRGLRHLRLVGALLQLIDAEEARAGGKDVGPMWESVADTFEGIDCPLPAAYCWYHQARSLLAAHGDRHDAATALARARRSASQLGAAPLVARIDDLARRSRLDVTRAEAPPPHGLSDREMEVLRLVRDGYTNPEIAAALFISRKTASHHVSSILAKLGVSTRREAADRARRLGL